MAMIPNLDHRMPQHIDVFQHMEECARKNLCTVWGCGKPADKNDHEVAPGIFTPFEVAFCSEHLAGFTQYNKEYTEGKHVDEGT